VAALVAATVLVAGVVAYGVFGRGSGDKTDVDTASRPTITEQKVEFLGAGGQRLAGTLTMPAIAPGTTAVPGALIVSGWGVVDRDSVIAGGSYDGTADALSTTLAGSRPASVDNLYQDLSQALAKAGVATFRWDKRGTAASRPKPDESLSFDDEVADVRAAVDFLAQRREVSGAPIALVGHDEGGVLAMRAAAGSPKVKAVALVSTPGRTLVDVVADDLQRSRGPEMAAALRAAASQLATGPAPAPDSLPPLLRNLFPTSQAPYLRSVFSVDPQAEAAKVTVPALVVGGASDPSRTPVDVERLSSVLGAHGLKFIQGSDATDHNLSLGGPSGHTHMNNNQTAAAPGHDDAALTGLATWVKTRLSA
jgi:pimeloyl-ACP methyl ester carboxylesterase